MPLRFNTPGYDEAVAGFVDSVVSGTIRQDPVLGEIPTRKHAYPTASTDVGDSGQFDRATFRVEQVVTFEADALRRGDIAELTSTLRRAAEDYRDQIGAQVVEKMREMTDAAGQSIDVGGRLLSYDLILDALETYEFDFAADGTPTMPTIMMNPATAEILSRMEVTPEHMARLENILRRKKAEHDAHKRHRRLPGAEHDAQERARRLPG